MDFLQDSNSSQSVEDIIGAIAQDPGLSIKGLSAAYSLACSLPSQRDVVRSIVKHWSIPEDIAAAAEALIGFVEDANAYNAFHNPAHHLHVAIVVMKLLDLHQDLRISEDRDLRYTLFLSALGHDILHPGKFDQTILGIPYYLEKIAAECTFSILIKQGLEQNLAQEVHDYIFCTYPMIRSALKDPTDCYAFSHPVARVMSDPIKLEAARILGDADLFFSLGAGAEIFEIQTAKILDEAGIPKGEEAIELGLKFLESLGERKFISAPGSLYESCIQEILDKHKLRKE